MNIYTTQDGDMIDDIAFRYYGHTKNSVEQILLENEGLAERPLLLPSGIEIRLPELTAPVEPEVKVRLWD